MGSNKPFESSPNVETDLSCKICKKTFSNLSNKRRHLNIHDPNAVKHKCEICTKEFSHKYKLKMHLIIHDKIKKKLKCDICKKDFSQSISLYTHVKFVHGNHTYHCNICGTVYC